MLVPVKKMRKSCNLRTPPNAAMTFCMRVRQRASCKSCDVRPHIWLMPFQTPKSKAINHTVSSEARTCVLIRTRSAPSQKIRHDSTILQLPHTPSLPSLQPATEVPLGSSQHGAHLTSWGSVALAPNTSEFKTWRPLSHPSGPSCVLERLPGSS